MQRKNVLFVLLLLGVCSLRLVFPDADPSLLKSTYDVCDEAWWAENARNKLLNDSWFPGEYAGGIAVAPLYSLFLFLFFKTGGISLFTLRLLPLLASTGTVLLVFGWLNRFNRRHAMMASLMLALSHSAFMYSRLGHLETTMLFFMMLGAYLFSLRSNLYMALAGTALAAAVLTKFSALAFIPVALVWVVWLLKHSRLSGLQAFLYSSGFALPMAAYYVFWHRPNSESMYLFFDYLSNQVFVKSPGSADLLTRLAFFSQKEFFTEPSMTLLVILAGAGILIASPMFPRQGAKLYEPFYFSVIWIAVYSAVLFFTDFNNRRFVLLSVPLCVAAAQFLAKPNQATKISLPPWLSWTLVFVLAFQVLSLHLNLHAGEWLFGNERNPDTRNSLTLYTLALAFAIGFVVLVLASKVYKWKSLANRLLPWSLLAFFAVTIVQAVVFLKKLGLLPDHPLAVALPVGFAISLAVLLIGFGKRAAGLALAAAYAIVCLLFTGYDLFQARFSLKDSMAWVKQEIPGEGPVIGAPQFFELYLTSDLRPLYYSVDDPSDPSILKRHAVQKPKYYATGFAGTDSLHYAKEKAMVEATLPADLRLVKSFGWFANHPDSMRVCLFELLYR